MISQTPFGRAPAGAVTLFELTAGAVRIQVMDFGATLVRAFTPDRTGAVADIALGFDALAGYLANPACYGGTIGPSANRTDRAEVPIGNAVHRLPENDGPGSANNLHTDLDHGLHKRIWSSEVDEAANLVRFTCELADGELGLPGARRFTVTYALAEEAGGAVLTLEHACATDAPTYVNMTNHSYFDLGGAGSGRAMEALVAVRAAHFLPVREDSVSTGEIRPVAGTPFDFREPKRLDADIEADDEQLRRGRGYDHCLVVDGYEPGAGPRPALRAEDPVSGRVLSIDITAPGAHLYTGNWLDDADAKDGASFGARDGFAFEPEFLPDNVHHADWEHPVCTPESPYRQSIIYRFSTRAAR
ncbi:MAG: galactose mutarotase [Coriobacteriaceae bacterium]|nr:galactose mutarotase [Coriobacteriaceae bacterium]